MAKRSERQDLQIRTEREMSVAKRDDMIQKGCNDLSIQEQRCVLYAVSKIKPDDSVFQEYTFELKDFYALCGIEKESYTELKKIMKGLSDRSWWAEIDDKGTESLLRWFSTFRTNKKSGKVTVKFHEDMMPYLLDLSKQGRFYTTYSLQYILPMKSQYSTRLYELLKSYQKNNREWFFSLSEIKRLLGAEKYTRYPDFRRFVLEPAVEEINKFSDLKIAYIAEKEGRAVARITFLMAEKNKKALLQAKRNINEALDGNRQIDILEVLQNYENDPRTKFWREQREQED